MMKIIVKEFNNEIILLDNCYWILYYSWLSMIIMIINNLLYRWLSSIAVIVMIYNSYKWLLFITFISMIVNNYCLYRWLSLITFISIIVNNWIVSFRFNHLSNQYYRFHSIIIFNHFRKFSSLIMIDSRIFSLNSHWISYSSHLELINHIIIYISKNEILWKKYKIIIIITNLTSILS